MDLKLPRHFLWTTKIEEKKMAERMRESMEGMTKGYIGDLPRISAHVMIRPLPWLSVHPSDHNVKKAPISNKRPPSFLNFFNSLTPKISLVILLAVSHAVLVMLVWRIWYWIHFYSPYWYFFVILITCLLDIVLILYWYCREQGYKESPYLLPL